MRKLFVSVPMGGRSREDIVNTVYKMKRIAEILKGEQFELVDSFSYTEKNYVDFENTHAAIMCLGYAIQKLADADLLIGIDEYYDWRGCQVEALVADRYGIESIRVHAKDVIDDYEALVEERFWKENSQKPTFTENDILKTHIAECTNETTEN